MEKNKMANPRHATNRNLHQNQIQLFYYGRKKHIFAKLVLCVCFTLTSLDAVSDINYSILSKANHNHKIVQRNKTLQVLLLQTIF
jgi:hypothetical protein